MFQSVSACVTTAISLVAMVFVPLAAPITGDSLRAPITGDSLRAPITGDSLRAPVARVMPAFATGTVRYVSLAGNDRNTCLSQASACRTVQGAVDKSRGGDRIVIAPGVYAGTTTLGKSVTLTGAGTGRTILDARRRGRVITVTGGATVALAALALRHGRVPDQQSGGGGLYARDSRVTLTNCTVALNTADASNANQGGGIYVSGSRLALTSTTVSDNSSANGGGGIFAANGSTVTLTGSALTRNTSTYVGGLYIGYETTAKVTASTVARNTGSGNSGGIEVDSAGATLSLLRSSVTYNTAGGNGAGGLSASSGGRAQVTGSTVGWNVSQGDAGGIDAGNGGTITLTRSQVIHNRAAGVGGGLNIASNGHMALLESTVGGNTAGYAGGGIHLTTSTLSLTRSTVEGNTVAVSNGAGGGILATGGSIVRMVESTVRQNVGRYYGGGLLADHEAQVTIERSAIVGNRNIHPYFGGGGIALTQAAAVTLTNSIVADNAAVWTRPMPYGSAPTTASGGGIMLPDENGSTRLVVIASTIAGNRATDAGGGIYNARGNDQGHVPLLRDSIVATNTAAVGADCFGTLVSGGYNLLGTGSRCGLRGGTGDRVNVDPRLGPLQSNGGATQTRALLNGSPAIDAVPVAACAGLTTDQRGYRRPTGSVCDMGAFEAGAPAGPVATPTAGSGQATPPATPAGQPTATSMARPTATPGPVRPACLDQPILSIDPAPRIVVTGDKAPVTVYTRPGTKVTLTLQLVAAGAHVLYDTAVMVTADGRGVATARMPIGYAPSAGTTATLVIRATTSCGLDVRRFPVVITSAPTRP